MGNQYQALEEKWQKRWEDSGIFRVEPKEMKDKYYVLVMFPYPSGDKLHMGHWWQYGLMDSWARFQRFQKKPVFFPMGFDAFGLPAENYAIKHGIHPDISTSKNVSHMLGQFQKMGVSYNFEHSVNTSKPDYYRWTQWVFLKLFEKGLAYQKEAPVNWCPHDLTVLANEQVLEGRCERCETPVVQKNLKQWFFKITDYAQKLLDGLDTIDWPSRTVAMQKNWIGRSSGTLIQFQLERHEEGFEVFTTRPDTLYGVTGVVLAPEHALTLKITTPDQKASVETYIEESRRLSDIERQSTTREKTGVFTGAYAIHPLTSEKVPVWVGDYVLGHYGTGAVMSVPAHDERDFSFAKKYDLKIRQVILKDSQSHPKELQEAFTEDGILCDSAQFDGQNSKDARENITQHLEEKKLGGARVQYRLRDWLVSRQRYWGSPIPIVHCDDCGAVPVPEDQLPVVLPENVDFQPHGESPLARCEDFVNTPCPKCKKPARREIDTLDTFVCSSWYYLRYPDSQNQDLPFEPELMKKMMPVDKYVGGPEHACMHLLYARFINMVMHDMGLVPTSEPFRSLTHQGMILGADGQKMSKSKGNSVSPDEYVAQYGADVLRLYLAFGFSYVDGGPWDEGGFKAASRFAERVNRLFDENSSCFTSGEALPESLRKEDQVLMRALHVAIQGVTQDTERFQFNTSIARLMELTNALQDYVRQSPHQGVLRHILESFMILLSPFMPHFCEELWEQSGHQGFIAQAEWPAFDSSWLELDEITMAVSVNGKVRAEITVPKDAQEPTIVEAALVQASVARQMEGKTIIKKILVPGKLINLIVK